MTTATGMFRTNVSQYCFWRWSSRKSPALWIASTDWAAKVWRVATRSGEKTPSSRRMMTRPPRGFFTDQRQGEQRPHPLPNQERSHLLGDQLPLVRDVGDLHRLPAHTGAPHGALADPDRRGPDNVQVVLREVVRGPRQEHLGGLLELVHDPGIAVRELDGPN